MSEPSELQTPPPVSTTPPGLGQVYTVDSILNIQRDLGGLIEKVNRTQADVTGLSNSVTSLESKVDQLVVVFGAWRWVLGIIAMLAVFVMGKYSDQIFSFLAGSGGG